MWGAVRVHFFLGGSHLSLQELLKTRNSLQCLAGEVQHVLGAQESGMVFQVAVERSRGAWGVVENYSSAIEQACQEMLRVQLHTTHGPPPTRLRSFDAATDGKGAFIMGGFWCQRHGCSWAQPLAAQPASCLPSLADHDVLRFPGAVAFAPGCAHGKTLVQHIYGQMEQLKLDSHLSLGSRNTKIHDASSLCAASATL
jgi:hypothetical protein